MKELNDIIYNWSFALFDLANEKDVLETITEQVVEINQTLKKNKDYLSILNSYVIDLKTKYQYIDEAFSFYHEYIVNIIKLVAKANIGKYLINIFHKFIELSNQKMNITHGVIYTATELQEKQIQEFETKLSKKLNKKVVLINKIDESLIAGIKIKIGDYVIENSIIDQINKLKQYINNK
ncbi:F0F1 ATP synthase subunit delta [Metamycoplasma cloacale]|uniref:ATP synthase subunit delta n=1 Tax=Metamycoplasma cloacale TaxID=92401 RepID=A0A2Z4LN60_9BACT|nr:F0F1 ATP synthase subunit delta [Metamycoplasma cloacale]AWX42687.1 ATP synthase F1 subunit delta [Metamycoplasma cloacale]VEU79501.1 F0F1 ATP synthase subunit delta [Metamycoplasma cloacale]